MEALTVHRLQFAFTITYHYLFPQLTMGLAFLIFVLKSLHYFRGDEIAGNAARFWLRVFGLGFVMGVVTGIPMEFQFGTNWARFSRMAGGVVGQTLAMEGIFAFFLESSFLYLLLFAEERISKRLHWVTSLLLWLGTWLSGFFIVCTNAWMQHPTGHRVLPDGRFELTSLGALLTNPWALVQYAHTMIGALITGCFVMAAVGAYYLLRGHDSAEVRRFTRLAVIAGVIASISAAMPTGDVHAKLVAKHQPVTFAAMEGHFHTEKGAGLTFVGQPDMEKLELDNPLILPRALSFMTHQRWDAEIRGLTEFPRDQWPDNIPLLYYSYHIMVGLGTMFMAVMGASAFLLFRKKLFGARPLLWVLMLSAPFPFIANTAGWYTAELGRQPWVVYGLMRTAHASSENVSSGNALFSLLGFMGLYALLSVLCVLLFARIVTSAPWVPQRDPALATEGAH
jgi:cytochrome d ubiquinol oxidase subunit I